MERKMSKKLAEWKKSKNRMPLILYGARQVGKTYTVLTFGKEQYKSTAYFDLENNKELVKIFDRDLEPDRIIRELSALSGQNILKEDTLIFFDEIQASERALTSLKYFYEKAPEYHVIAAGSLLGVAVNREQHSFPVGKVEMMTLYPLDFEEFIWTIANRDFANMIRECYIRNTEFSLHRKALDLYYTYIAVGGMPAVLNEYIESRDFNFVLAKQKNINDAYVSDMAKYASARETVKIIEAYNSIPAQLAKENKKFQYKEIKSGARAYDYEHPIAWLSASGIIVKCIKINEGKLPLNIFADASFFKIYMMDTGLLFSKFNIPVNTILADSIGFDNYKGILTENYVASTLVSSGFQAYYWESKGRAEVDFVIQKQDGSVIPVEVKSSENVRSKSLGQFVLRYKPSYSVRISPKNFGFENGIKSVPLYAVFCLADEDLKSL
jgi:hypothetical protein